MKKVLFASALLAIATASIGQASKSIPKTKPVKKPLTKPTTSSTALKSLKDSASYALGVNIARNLKAQSFDSISIELLQKGLNDVFANKKVDLGDESANNTISEYQQQVSSAKAGGNKAKGKAFMTANAKKAGVISLPNGIQYEILKTGKDTTKPKLEDKVKCHYHGTLIDGTVFDSSVDRGEPISFPLNGVIKGWQEALQLMTVGSKWRLVIPSDLAYGDNAAGPKIGPGSTLIFEVELIAIEK